MLEYIRTAITGALSPSLPLSLSLSLSLFLSVACGNDKKAPVDEYAGRFSSALCAELEACCTANGLGFDRTNCEQGGAGFVQQGVDQARMHDARFDPDQANACIEGAARLARSCQPIASEQQTQDACSGAFVGVKNPGEACNSDLDCARGEEGRGACYVLASDGSGVCVLLRSGAQAGDTCVGTVGQPPPRVLADCLRSDLQCDLATSKCKALTAVGGDCPGFTVCVKDAYCDASMKCVARKAAAAACQQNAECTSGFCLRGACAQNSIGAPTPCTGER